MKLKNFAKLCNSRVTSLIICTKGKQYTEKEPCDFVFSFDEKAYKNNYWTGRFRVNGKAYKDADVEYVEPFSEKSIKVYIS